MKENITYQRGLSISLLIMLITFLITTNSYATNYSDEIQGPGEDPFEKVLKETKLPALQAVIMTKGDNGWSTAWSGAYGHLTVDENSPLVTEDTIFIYASVTKTFTAATVLKLADDENYNFDIDDLASKYLCKTDANGDEKCIGVNNNKPRKDSDGNVINENGDDITVRQLLNMRAGLFSDIDTEENFKLGEVEIYPYHWGEQVHTRSFHNKNPLALGLEINVPLSLFEPTIINPFPNKSAEACLDGRTDDGNFDCFRRPILINKTEIGRYSNFSYELLGFIIENVTKKTWAEAVYETILVPLNMHETTGFYWADYRKGAALENDNKVTPYFHGLGFSFPCMPLVDEGFSEGTMKGTAKDLANFFKVLLNDELFFNDELLLNNGSFITEHSYEDMQKNLYPQYIQGQDEKKVKEEELLVMHYGMGWLKNTLDIKIFDDSTRKALVKTGFVNEGIEITGHAGDGANGATRMVRLKNPTWSKNDIALICNVNIYPFDSEAQVLDAILDKGLSLLPIHRETIGEHIAAGRAEHKNNEGYFAVGSGDFLGMHEWQTVTLEETSKGFYEIDGEAFIPIFYRNTLKDHVAAKRAIVEENEGYLAEGSDDLLGFYDWQIVTLSETSKGYFEIHGLIPIPIFHQGTIEAHLTAGRVYLDTFYRFRAVGSRTILAKGNEYQQKVTLRQTELNYFAPIVYEGTLQAHLLAGRATYHWWYGYRAVGSNDRLGGAVSIFKTVKLQQAYPGYFNFLDLD